MESESTHCKRLLPALTKGRILFFCLFVVLFSCKNQKYNTILLVDAEAYRPVLSWDQIREMGFKMPYTVRVFDSNGQTIQLYRHNHDDGSIMPLNVTEIHFSTPVIIDRKYASVSFSLLDHSNEVTTARVNLNELKPVNEASSAYVAPIKIPKKG